MRAGHCIHCLSKRELVALTTAIIYKRIVLTRLCWHCLVVIRPPAQPSHDQPYLPARTAPPWPNQAGMSSIQRPCPPDLGLPVACFSNWNCWAGQQAVRYENWAGQQAGRYENWAGHRASRYHRYLVMVPRPTYRLNTCTVNK